MAWVLDSQSSMLACGTRRVTTLHLCSFWLSLPSVTEDSSGVVGVELSPLSIGVQVTQALEEAVMRLRGGEDAYAGVDERKVSC